MKINNKRDSIHLKEEDQACGLTNQATEIDPTSAYNESSSKFQVQMHIHTTVVSPPSETEERKRKNFKEWQLKSSTNPKDIRSLQQLRQQCPRAVCSAACL
jgi:hypothetical protein